MISRLKRGSSRPQTIMSTRFEEPLRLDDVRFDAWAVALGQRRINTEPGAPRRPHRGALADLDAGRLEPMPRRRFLAGLLAALGLGGSSAGASETAPALAPEPVPLGRPVAPAASPPLRAEIAEFLRAA